MSIGEKLDFKENYTTDVAPIEMEIICSVNDTLNTYLLSII